MIRIGLIGCGHWGKNYFRLFSQSEEVELVGVADPDVDSTRNFIGVKSSVKVYPSYLEMIEERKLQAVIVSTPASSHFEIISRCLDAGLDVLAEKPITQKVEDADVVVQKAKDNCAILMVGHTFLYNLAVRKVKELIEAGSVGSIYYMKATRTHLGIIRNDVNAVWDLAPHDISILNYFAGESPVGVQAIGARFLGRDWEDAGFIHLRYPKGVIASIHVSWADANKVRKVEVVGSKARIVFDDLDLVEPVRLYKKGVEVNEDPQSFGDFKYAIRDGDIVSPSIRIVEPLRVMCNHFLECVRTRCRPFTPGEDGREVVRVLGNIDAAMGHQC